VEKTRTELLVIGFDGLDYELFRKHNSLDLEVLPLYSPVPVTGPAWTSIYTGDSVGTHEVRDGWGFPYPRRYARTEIAHRLLWQVRRIAGRVGLKTQLPRYRSYRTTQSAYVWESLNKANITTNLVNLPATNPVRPINGSHLAGFPLGRNDPWCYPHTLRCFLPPDYPQLCDIIQWYEEPVRDYYAVWRNPCRLVGTDPVMARTGELSRKLADLFLTLPEADFEMVQFSFVDRFGHAFGLRGEIENFCYGLVRELIDYITSRRHAESLMLVSDHGFQRDEHTDLGCLGVSGSIVSALRVSPGYQPRTGDIAPTIADYFGVAHPSEGRSLLSDGTNHTDASERDGEERTQIITRMRQLGYM